MERQQKVGHKVTVLFSKSPLSLLMTKYALLESDVLDVSLVLCNPGFLFPTCCVDNPLQYLAQMYPGIATVEKEEPRRLTLKSQSYFFVKSLARRLLANHMLRTKVKQWVIKFHQSRNQAVVGKDVYQEATFPQAIYDVVWERFLSSTISNYYRQFACRCHLKWNNMQSGKPQLEGEEQSLLIQDVDMVTSISQAYFYVLLCSKTTVVEKALELREDNVFFLFEDEEMRQSYIKHDEGIKQYSLALPAFVFYPGQLLLSNQSYLKELIISHGTRSPRPLKEKVVFIELSGGKEQQEILLLKELNKVDRSQGTACSIICHTSKNRAAKLQKQFPDLFFLEGLLAELKYAAIQEADVYLALESLPDAIWAGLSKTCIIANDTTNFKWLFGATVLYEDFKQAQKVATQLLAVLKSDTLCEKIKSSAEKYSKETFSSDALREKVNTTIQLRYLKWKLANKHLPDAIV